MNTTAVRRLSSTLSHLYKNIPKMAYQTRIIGVSFDSFVPHLFFFHSFFFLSSEQLWFLRLWTLFCDKMAELTFGWMDNE